ncbi:plancitoxin-1 [Atheta coriaria]|uniref:plancitoxin-1 n=1 Tax=Dalotia coriaria TaxID=877792 RepID=UPI0031F38B9C
MDENNNPVDWYILYKIPHIKKGAPSELIKNGFAYMYLTSDNDENWTLSNINIMDNEKSFLATTLAPVYQSENDNNIAHIFYNDEKPSGGNKGTKGHTKGALATDQKGGFWLIHSTPAFPPSVNDNYSYPLSGTVYGQSILCISLDTLNLNNAALQLFYDQPQVYSSNFPSDLMLYYPNMKRIIDHESIDSPPWFMIQSLKTLKEQEFVSFAKTKDFSKELYEDLVAPGLNSSLEVESWLNGPGKLASNCSKHFSVKNIEEITLKEADVSFSSSLDHSKWAVSSETNQNWICIGDINRAEHQKKRGGGTTCINNPQIAHLYKQAAVTIENCNKMS